MGGVGRVEIFLCSYLYLSSLPALCLIECLNPQKDDETQYCLDFRRLPLECLLHDDAARDGKLLFELAELAPR